MISKVLRNITFNINIVLKDVKKLQQNWGKMLEKSISGKENELKRKKNDISKVTNLPIHSS